MLILYIVLTLLITTSILYTWFNSSLPGLTFGILKSLGLKRKDKQFWLVQATPTGIEELDYIHPFHWTQNDFENFALMHLGMLGKLLTCRFCLCYHACLWCNLLTYLFCWLFINPTLLTLPSFPLLLLIIISQPILVHLIYNLVDHLEKR
jgi:hypothetical protein